MANGAEVVVDYRDAARTPMHWDASANAGFTTGLPWISMAPNHHENNVAVETADPDSLLNHYRRLIHMRNDSIALHGGDFQVVPAGSSSAYAFFRATETDSVLVVLNLSRFPQTFTVDLRETPWNGRTGQVLDLYSGSGFPDLLPENTAGYPATLATRGFALLRLSVDGAGTAHE